MVAKTFFEATGIWIDDLLFSVEYSGAHAHPLAESRRQKAQNN